MKAVNVLIPVYDKDVVGDIPTEISEQCLRCRHLNSNKITCFAFPDIIPPKITSGGFDHRKPFKGDNGIQYEVRA